MAFVVSTERGRPRRAVATSPSRSVLPFGISLAFSGVSAAGATGYALTKASRVPLPAAGGTTMPPALCTPVAPSAFSAAALGQAGQRHAGIALAELIPGQEHEIGAVTARGYGHRAIHLVAHVAIDH